MSPALLCADPHHPLTRLIAAQFALQSQPPEAALAGAGEQVMEALRGRVPERSRA